MLSTDQEFFTAAQAAALLAVDNYKIIQLIKRGELLRWMCP